MATSSKIVVTDHNLLGEARSKYIGLIKKHVTAMVVMVVVVVSGDGHGCCGDHGGGGCSGHCGGRDGGQCGGDNDDGGDVAMVMVVVVIMISKVLLFMVVVVLVVMVMMAVMVVVVVDVVVATVAMLNCYSFIQAIYKAPLKSQLNFYIAPDIFKTTQTMMR